MNYFLLGSVAIILGLLIMSGDNDYHGEPQTCSIKLPTIGFGIKEGQWNYKNTDKWGVFPNSSCDGLSQSPIDINPDLVSDYMEQHVDIEYAHDTSLNVRRHTVPHTMEVTGTYSHIRVPDFSGHIGLYRSLQFHLHVPSEHTVRGKYYPLEIHFVHLADKEGCDKLKNKLSVLGIFVEIDEKSDSKFFNSWEFANEGQIINGFSLYQSIMKTIPKDAKFFTYTGSLTTPPCTETVNWFVMEKPIGITSDQFVLIQDYFRNPQRFQAFSNNRPTLPMNGRKLSKIPFHMTEYFDHVHDAGGHGGHGSEASGGFLGEFTCCYI